MPKPKKMSQKTLNTLDELVAAGLMSAQQAQEMPQLAARYAIAVPHALAQLIAPDTPNDPIARQFVPSRDELERSAIERDDPIGDHAFMPVPHLVHRYPDRVLLKLVSACPVYCRFCFRREMVGPSGASIFEGHGLETALAYIAAHPEIFEVIFTGGDPLALSARRLSEVTQKVAAIPHVRVLRWHSRVPVATPQHITPQVAAALRVANKAVYIAIHANHPRELSVEALAACAYLSDAGLVLLSQSVLLAGVNDDEATLEALMRAFIAARIKPYYLHQMDLAPGTAHFRVPIERGLALMQALRGRLSGLGLPHYMLDIPGGYGKIPITSDTLVKNGDSYVVTDYRGNTHVYPPQ